MRQLKVIFSVLCIFLLCGCWDYNELNMQELVLGVGIDETPFGISVTVQTAGRDGEESAVYVTEGEGFFDAVRNATSHIGKKLYWGHCRIIIFGESAAESRIGEVLDVLERSQDIYMNISVASARGCTAGEIISAKLEGKNSVEGIFDTLSNEGNSKRFRDVRIWELMREKSLSDAYVLPTIEISDKMVSVGGGAVINNDSLKGFLNDEEMLLYVLMTESGAGGYMPPLTMPSGEHISLEILKNDAKLDLRNGTAEIGARVVVSIGGGGADVNDSDLRSICEAYLNKKGSELVAYIRDKELGDIFEISSAAQQRNKGEQYKWENLKNVNVKFDVVVNRAGMLREGEE